MLPGESSESGQTAIDVPVVSGKRLLFALVVRIET
jgi:hypothetical protein